MSDDRESTPVEDLLAEWDHHGGWRPSKADFELLRGAYDALRMADPQATYEALSMIVGDIGAIDGEASRKTAAVMLRRYLAKGGAA